MSPDIVAVVPSHFHPDNQFCIVGRDALQGNARRPVGWIQINQKLKI